MTRQEIADMLREAGVYFDEDHPDHIAEEKLESLLPPFMEFTATDKPVNADGRRYIDIKQLTVRLYSDTEETEAESGIEGALEARDLRWRKNREYMDDLGMWAITYTLEV